MLCVSFSIYWCFLKDTVNNSQSRCEWFSFVDKYSFLEIKLFMCINCTENVQF